MKETGKYRKKDEPTNDVCDLCNLPIWRRISSNAETVYDGKGYYNNNLSIINPESIIVLERNETKFICFKCFKKRNK